MRFKDFDDETKPSTVMSKYHVSVSTMSYQDSEKMAQLRQKNHDYLKPWVAMPSSVSNESHIYTVLYKDVLVGQIILWNFKRTELENTCYASYWIDESYKSRGIATIALELVASYCFSNLDIDVIEAAIQPHNFPSIRVVQKLGFIKTKSIPNYLVVDGKARDHDVFSLRDLITT